MINVDLICVGKLKEAYWRDACAEYEKRLSGFCRIQVIEVEEERMPESPSASQIEGVLKAEGKRILSRVSAGAALIALCIEGKEFSSVELSRYLEGLAVSGTSRVVLVIGGSWGLSNEVKQAAGLRLSMSPLTFPHQLARVMLLEQVYRALQISAGGKYHK